LAITGLQDDITPLHVASRWGRSSIISLLIDNHANIEAMTKVSQSHASLIDPLFFVCLLGPMSQGTVPGARRQGRPHTAWMDKIKTWTGLSVEESVRMTEDRDKWRKYVRGVANPWTEDG